jgi:hypothetical protein
MHIANNVNNSAVTHKSVGRTTHRSVHGTERSQRRRLYCSRPIPSRLWTRLPSPSWMAAASAACMCGYVAGIVRHPHKKSRSGSCVCAAGACCFPLVPNKAGAPLCRSAQPPFICGHLRGSHVPVTWPSPKFSERAVAINVRKNLTLTRLCFTLMSCHIKQVKGVSGNLC